MELLFAVLGTAALYGAFALIHHFLALEHDPLEPPLVSSKIPFIGHVINLVRHGLQYYDTLHSEAPIYTLQMFTRRTYIITSLDLIAEVQKSSSISHLPIFMDGAADKVSGASPEGLELVNRNLMGEDGDWGLQSDTSRGLHRAMAPGPALDQMTKAMVDEFSLVFDEFSASLKTPRNGPRSGIKLFQWVRHAVTVAVTNAAYGPLNPFKFEPSLEPGFWIFESHLSTFLAGLAPKITARTAYYCRDKLSRAMEVYFSNGDYTQGSGLVRSNHEANLKHHLPSVDQGRFQMPNLSALLVNTAPASFWLLWHIYSDRALLAAIRQELDALVLVDSEGVWALDLSKLKDHAPLLFSSYQEALRLHAHGAQVRSVLEDTTLGSWNLKKGAIVHMPAAAIHSDPAVWGPDAGVFNPRRFWKTGQLKGFRTFSSGSTLCPGRQFATSTIMAFVAMCVLWFEVVGEGGWETLEMRRSGSLVAFLVAPEEGVEVRVGVRQEMEGEWKFGLGEKEKRWGLACG